MLKMVIKQPKQTLFIYKGHLKFIVCTFQIDDLLVVSLTRFEC